jgi:hypothetical protein
MAAGDSPTSWTANPAMRRCTQSASPATSRQRIETLFSHATRRRLEPNTSARLRSAFLFVLMCVLIR